MKRACDVTYGTAGIVFAELKDIRIPIADIPTMIKTKQGVRPRDKSDLSFLKSLEEKR